MHWQQQKATLTDVGSDYHPDDKRAIEALLSYLEP